MSRTDDIFTDVGPDAEARRERERRESEYRRQLEDDLAEVLGTRAGRAVVWHVITRASGVFSPTYSGEETHQAAYYEGRRAIGIHLMQEAQRVAPRLYLRMLGEHVGPIPDESRDAVHGGRDE